MIQLIRTKKTNDGIFGKLLIDGQETKFVSLENLLKPIPVGSYTCNLTDSPRFDRLMPEILNVPGRDGIRIHWANYPEQLEGCVALGDSLDGDAIDDSKDAWNSFMSQMEGHWPTVIEVTEQFQQPA